MAIPASCTYCGTKIHLQASATGKKVRCPSCSGVNQIGEMRDGAYRLVGEESEEPTILQAERASHEPPPPRVAQVSRNHRSDARTPAADQGTTPFVLGLIGIIMCPILGPFAWISGNTYRDECAARDEIPGGLGTAGRIMGMIGTGFVVLQFLGVLFFLLLAVAGSGM